MFCIMYIHLSFKRSLKAKQQCFIRMINVIHPLLDATVQLMRSGKPVLHIGDFMTYRPVCASPAILGTSQL